MDQSLKVYTDNLVFQILLLLIIPLRPEVSVTQSNALLIRGDLRDNYWGRVYAVEMLKLPNGTNSGGLAISSRCWIISCNSTKDGSAYS